MITTELRGAKFRPFAAQQLVLTLPVGQPLILEPEPTNQYDPNAIRILVEDAAAAKELDDPDYAGTDNVFIGFVAREHAAAVYELGMGKPETLTAYIEALLGHRPPITITLPESASVDKGIEAEGEEHGADTETA